MLVLIDPGLSHPRIQAHSSQIFEHPLGYDSKEMRKNIFAAFLVLAGFQTAHTSTGDVLLESRFLRDADGWFVTVENGNKKTNLVPSPLEFDRISKKIKSSDQGDLPWYFTAPNKYLGDKSSFYHGTLEFTLVNRVDRAY